MQDDKKETESSGKKAAKVIGIIAKVLLFLVGVAIICTFSFTCYKLATGMQNCAAPVTNLFK